MSGAGIAMAAETIGGLLVMALSFAILLRAWKWAARLAVLALLAVFTSVHGPSWLP